MHQIKFIIGSDKLGFQDRGKAEYLGTKLLGIREKTNNKLNPHIHLFWTTNLHPFGRRQVAGPTSPKYGKTCVIINDQYLNFGPCRI